MLNRKNVKCYKCKKPVAIDTLKLRSGKCYHCGYLIASSLSGFFK